MKETQPISSNFRIGSKSLQGQKSLSLSALPDWLVALTNRYLLNIEHYLLDGKSTTLIFLSFIVTYE